MPAKIRLQRHGKKGIPYYHIVVADSRAPRDGKFIERIGAYNPNTNPATIEINFEKALNWLHNGAQPTDTVRAVLSYKGVLYKKHLETGVKKGAITQEMADAQWTAWENQKQAKIEDKRNRVAEAGRKSINDRKSAETKVSEARAAAANKKAHAAAEAAVESAPEAEAATEAPAEG